MSAQGTRLLRQPSLSENNVVFVYGGDLWNYDFATNRTLRITSTSAIESNPHISPDGKMIAFSSNRSGGSSVYLVPINGGEPTRLSWHPSSSYVRGWTPTGQEIVFSSARETAPKPYNRLWKVPTKGGPSSLISNQWGYDGSFAADGKQIALDRVSRWDSEWRGYRGGQNTPLVVLNLNDNSEILIPNEKTTDIQPLWLGDKVYFLSDREGVSNIWSFHPVTKLLNQITNFTGSDIKWLDGKNESLIYERDGYFHTLNLSTNQTDQLNIQVTGDFPWAETKWEDLSEDINEASISPTGKRVILEARGEIFTAPVKHGNSRNITLSSGAADRKPLWSPNGEKLAWFSDKNGKAYELLITSQDGLSDVRNIPLGESIMVWEPTWSPDGESIAYVDDDLRIKILNIKSGSIQQVDIGGTNIERGNMGLSWSPESKWLAYAKSGSNGFQGVYVWSVENKEVNAVTNPFADAHSPSWDRDGKHMYFLASTDFALRSGWANTSSMTAKPEYAAYVVNLLKNDPSPFIPRSDEETVEDKKEEDEEQDKEKDKDGKEEKDDDEKGKEDVPIKIDFENIERRTMPLPMPVANYYFTLAGPEGTVFIGERKPNSNGLTIHKFELEERESKEFVDGARSVSISADGENMLASIHGSWKVMGTKGPSGKDGKSVKLNIKMKLDRAAEWKQIFEEAWRYERDFFYDPNMHGRDWQVVYDRYAPLIPFVKHRSDLTYVLDQVNGELSVGHSFVFGGDYPERDRSVVGLLGADLKAKNSRWEINRIFTTESWNPGLTSPLDRPDLKIQEGYYLVGVNGKELKSTDDPFEFLDGTADVQTILHINSAPEFKDSWQEIVEPIRSEYNLRQRAWVEDNRRLVDRLSDGKLAYVWVPNTSGNGFVSFNRYFFAQQDKLGAVIDERFNGGGLLDDYMVDLMTRKLRAAATNEVPNGNPLRLPAGILGPKVLLINEMAGSGGDFFPWVFRQQNAGPLIGTTTWGGLVKSSVHYGLVDGGALTAPDNAIFDPVNNKWIAENEGVAPDIEVRQDALALSKGDDPQLLKAIEEALRLVEQETEVQVIPPKFSTPAKKDK